MNMKSLLGYLLTFKLKTPYWFPADIIVQYPNEIKYPYSSLFQEGRGKSESEHESVCNACVSSRLRSLK